MVLFNLPSESNGHTRGRGAWCNLVVNVLKQILYHFCFVMVAILSVTVSELQYFIARGKRFSGVDCIEGFAIGRVV